jgi:hypothetical protein
MKCMMKPIIDFWLLECALTLARDLAYIWPRCPHPILSVCNSSITGKRRRYVFAPTALSIMNGFKNLFVSFLQGFFILIFFDESRILVFIRYERCLCLEL